jgi:hypothetical protein
MEHGHHLLRMVLPPLRYFVQPLLTDRLGRIGRHRLAIKFFGSGVIGMRPLK